MGRRALQSSCRCLLPAWTGGGFAQLLSYCRPDSPSSLHCNHSASAQLRRLAFATTTEIVAQQFPVAAVITFPCCSSHSALRLTSAKALQHQLVLLQLLGRSSSGHCFGTPTFYLSYDLWKSYYRNDEDDDDTDEEKIYGSNCKDDYCEGSTDFARMTTLLALLLTVVGAFGLWRYQRSPDAAEARRNDSS